MGKQPAGFTQSAAGLAHHDRPPDVGANLRAVRRQASLSLDALAGKASVSRAMLGQIENGRSVPTVTLLWRIARALDAALSELLGDAPVPKAQLLTQSTPDADAPGRTGIV